MRKNVPLLEKERPFFGTLFFPLERAGPVGAVARRALGTKGRPAREVAPWGPPRWRGLAPTCPARARTAGRLCGSVACAPVPGRPCRSRCSLATPAPGALPHCRARCARPLPPRRPPRAFHTAGRPCAWCTAVPRPPRGRPSPHRGARPLDTIETTQALFKNCRVFAITFFDKPGPEILKFFA